MTSATCHLYRVRGYPMPGSKGLEFSRGIIPVAERVEHRPGQLPKTFGVTKPDSFSGPMGRLATRV